MSDDQMIERDAAFAKTEGGSWDEVFDAGRDSVVFPPLSEFRDKFREMICEGDFDFTKIFEEIEYEGEKYADISNDGADALADYFLNLFEMIDEWRSEQVGYRSATAEILADRARIAAEVEGMKLDENDVDSIDYHLRIARNTTIEDVLAVIKGGK